MLQRNRNRKKEFHFNLIKKFFSPINSFFIRSVPIVPILKIEKKKLVDCFRGQRLEVFFSSLSEMDDLEKSESRSMDDLSCRKSGK